MVFPWFSSDFSNENLSFPSRLGMSYPDQLHKTMAGWWLTYPSEKYDFVNWDDIPFPTTYGKIKVMFQSPPTRHNPIISHYIPLYPIKNPSISHQITI